MRIIRKFCWNVRKKTSKIAKNPGFFAHCSTNLFFDGYYKVLGRQEKTQPRVTPRYCTGINPLQ